MRIFGFSIWAILMFVVVFWLGAKNPGIAAKIPLLNSL